MGAVEADTSSSVVAAGDFKTLLGLVSPESAHLLTLVYQQQLSRREIARRLDIDPDAAAHRIASALRELGHRLETRATQPPQR